MLTAPPDLPTKYLVVIIPVDITDFDMERELTKINVTINTGELMLSFIQDHNVSVVYIILQTQERKT
jgi:hypothetical protein